MSFPRPRFLKPILILRVSVLWFFLISPYFIHFQARTFAALNQDVPEEGALLKQLKIGTLKRNLRQIPIGEQASASARALAAHYNENRFRAVVAGFESLSEKEKSVPLLLIYGNAFFFIGQNEAAVGAYQTAFRHAATPDEKAGAMANFGWLLFVNGNNQAAQAWLERALKIDRSQAHYEAQGTVLSLLGNLYFQLGDPTKGAAAHIEALEIAETLPIPWLQARQLETLGRLYALDGTLHLAEEHFQKALNVYRTLENPLGEAAALAGLASVEQERGAFDLAMAHQHDALFIYRGLRDKENETQALVRLSLIYRDQGDFDSALDLGQRLLSMQKEAENLNGMAEMEGTLGTIYEKKGDLATAVRHWESALRLFQEAGLAQQIHIVELRIQTLQDRLVGEAELP